MGRAKMYTPQVRDAARVLGMQVAQARRERRLTAEDLAARAHISPVTLRKVERGDPSVALGTALEVATLVGVRLFGLEANELHRVARREQERLALLPERVRIPEQDPDDDF